MKYMCLLLVALFCYTGSHAQTDPNRTVKTKVADLLAQLPAQDATAYNKVMSELLSTGEEGLLQIMSLYKDPQQGDNTLIEFAVTGMSRYVRDEQQRKQFVYALLKAFRQTASKEGQFYLITTLRLVGNEECVKPLIPCLLDERLADVTARTFVTINTNNARAAILEAMKTATGNPLLSLVKAVGDMKISAAEPKLLEFVAQNENPVLKQATSNALAQLGTVASLKVLQKEAAAEKYVYDNQWTATEPYLLLLNRLVKEGNKAAIKQAASLNKSCNADNQIHVKSAALRMLVEQKGEAGMALLVKALKSKSRNYRMAALDEANVSFGDKAEALLLTQLNKANDPVKVDLLSYFGTRKDEKAVSQIIPLAQSANKEVAAAAIKALGLIGGADACKALATQFASEDDVILKATEAAFRSFKGNIGETLLAGMDNYSPKGANIAIALLGDRATVAAGEKVFSLLESSDAAKSAAAFDALKGVSQQKDLAKLFPLLNKQTDATRVSAVRNAILTGMATMDKQAKETLLMNEIKNAPAARKTDYYFLLGEVGSTNAQILDELFTLLKSGNDADKKNAVSILKVRTDHSAVISRSLTVANEQKELKALLLPVITTHLSAGTIDAEVAHGYIRRAFELADDNAVKNQLLTLSSNVKSLPSLLFTAQYLDNKDLQQTACVTVMNIALANPKFNSKEVVAALNKVLEVIEGGDSRYFKEAIRKHLSTLAPVEPFKLSAEEQKEGFKVLFDGTNMDSWTGNTAGYICEDGAIVCHPGAGGGGNLYTKEEYGNFNYRFEFMLTPGANNGLGIRTPLEGDAAYVGMELQILDNESPIYATLQPYQYHGSVYGIIPSKRGFLKPVGEWNTQEVIANGNHITVILNGTVIVDGDIAKATKNGTPDHREHPGLFNKKGHIAFLGHGSLVKFKNIRVKSLK